MSLNFPQAFLERMKKMLGGDFPAFESSLQQESWHGLRVNSLKISRDTFEEITPFELNPVPWCSNGFIYPSNQRPGKHPYHSAGLYYLQEPSAMAVADLLDVIPGERVLDLCAAPGGKSTQLAAALQGQGLLVSNEIHPARAKALSENIERLGIINALVTNETPDRLAARFPRYFDRILVDAPCSGEGMFRKLPEARDDWSEEKVQECHIMQRDILDAAAQMLKPGGVLVYSTCTFAPLENEQSIIDFLLSHSEFELLPLTTANYFEQGEPKWAQPHEQTLTKTARLWPHLLTGEGHFIAKLQKRSAAEADDPANAGRRKAAGKHSSTAAGRKEAIDAWRSFADYFLPTVAQRLDNQRAFILFGEQLYYSPEPDLDLSGIKIVRAGYHLGTVKKNRFEPSHALALSLKPEEVLFNVNFTANDDRLLRYLKGESLSHDGENGWTLITVDGYSIGWGKLSQGQIKNHYPKGLRWW